MAVWWALVRLSTQRQQPVENQKDTNGHDDAGKDDARATEGLKARPDSQSRASILRTTTSLMCRKQHRNRI